MLRALVIGFAGLLTMASGTACAQTDQLRTALRATGAHERTAYAKRAERAFLSNGRSMYVLLSGPASDKLRFHGYWNRAGVYQMVAETDLLKTSQKLGFREIRFDGPGSDGVWAFAVPAAGPIPRCSTLAPLCF